MRPDPGSSEKHLLKATNLHHMQISDVDEAGNRWKSLCSRGLGGGDAPHGYRGS
jgi:hypothetical protein